MFAQVSELTALEEQSMSKYDINEFLFPYKKVKGDYSYLTQISDDEQIETLFDLIGTFLISCHRPKHIEADTLKNIIAFGKSGFLKEDLQTLNNWSDCIIQISN